MPEIEITRENLKELCENAREIIACSRRGMDEFYKALVEAAPDDDSMQTPAILCTLFASFIEDFPPNKGNATMRPQDIVTYLAIIGFDVVFGEQIKDRCGARKERNDD